MTRQEFADREQALNRAQNELIKAINVTPRKRRSDRAWLCQQQRAIDRLKRRLRDAE